MSFSPVKRPVKITYGRRARALAPAPTAPKMFSTPPNEDTGGAELSEYISKSELTRRMLKRRNVGDQAGESLRDATVREGPLSKRYKQSTDTQETETDFLDPSSFQTPIPAAFFERDTLPSSLPVQDQYSPTPQANRFFTNGKENGGSRPSSRNGHSSRPSSRNGSNSRPSSRNGRSRTHSRRQSLASPFNSRPGSPKKKPAYQEKPIVRRSSDRNQPFQRTQPVQERDRRDPSFFSTGNSPQHQNHVRRPSNPNPQPAYIDEILAQDWSVPAKILSRAPIAPDTPYLDDGEHFFSRPDAVSTPYRREGGAEPESEEEEECGMDVDFENDTQRLARIFASTHHDSLFSEEDEDEIPHGHVSDLLTADLRAYTFDPNPPRSLGTLGDYEVPIAGSSPELGSGGRTDRDSLMDTSSGRRTTRDSLMDKTSASIAMDILLQLDVDGDEDMDRPLPSRTHSLDSALALAPEIITSNKQPSTRNRRGTLRASDFALPSASMSMSGVDRRTRSGTVVGRTCSGTVTGPGPPPAGGRARSGTIKSSSLAPILPPPPPPSVEREMSPFVARLLGSPAVPRVNKSPVGGKGKGKASAFTAVRGVVHEQSEEEEVDVQGENSSDDELLMKGHWNESDWLYAHSSSISGSMEVSQDKGKGKKKAMKRKPVPAFIKKINNTKWPMLVQSKEEEEDDELLLKSTSGMAIDD